MNATRTCRQRRNLRNPSSATSKAGALAEQLAVWHDDVHVTVSGAMGFSCSAPEAPIFWLWHAFSDDIYHEREWRRASVEHGLAVVHRSAPYNESPRSQHENSAHVAGQMTLPLH